MSSFDNVSESSRLTDIALQQYEIGKQAGLDSAYRQAH